MRTLSKRNRQDRNAKMDLLSMRNRHNARYISSSSDDEIIKNQFQILF